MGPLKELPGRRAAPSSVKAGTGRGGKCTVSDFPPPSAPIPTHPAPRTAPFPSLRPQTEKVCHRGTNAIFPGGRRRRNGEGRLRLCACGGRGKKPEVSELPSCEGRPHRTVTLTLASLSQKAQDGLWGRSHQPPWSRLLGRGTWRRGPKDADENFQPQTSFGQLGGPTMTANTPNFSSCSQLTKSHQPALATLLQLPTDKSSSKG